MDKYILKTIEAYDTAASKFSSTTDRMILEKEINMLIAMMPNKNLPILDVGCGPGRDSKFLSGKGLNVMGIDLSEKLLEKAKKLNPNIKYKKMDIRKLDFPDNYFGSMWCNMVLLHLKDKDLRIALDEIFRTLIMGGVIFVSFKEGEGEQEVLEQYTTNKSRFYNFKTKETLTKLLELHGFTVQKCYVFNERKRFGSDRRDLNVVCCFACKK